jgi:DNA-binding HxlR family transcriptional regulator
VKKQSPRTASDRNSSIRDVLDSIGNKWSYLVLLALAKRPMRFGDFRIEIDGISQRALTLTLRCLRRDGVVARDPVQATPPGVRYRLTELGESLVGPVRLLVRWAADNMATILQHRDTFDETIAQPPKPVIRKKNDS